VTRALRYTPKSGTRTVASRTADAARCIGPLYQGVHVTGLTAGQFSSIDALEHMAQQLGPCFAWVSTWTTGIYDVERARGLADNGSLLGFRFLLDRGTFEKSPQFAGPLIAALGESSFRCMSVHAKVTVLVDAGLRPLAVMRSSMNLNKNLRTEQFDISVGGKVAEFYADWFETLWDESGVGVDNVKIMKAIFERFEQLPKDDEPGDDPDLGSLTLDGSDVE
jgi:hypothetical protein